VSLDDLPAALHATDAIRTAQDIAKELRLGRYAEARRLLDVAREQIDAAEAAKAGSGEASGEHAG
jgi:hypothetical protein